MIPVEQFAGRTSRIAGYAAALRDLDQAWTGLQVRFDEAARTLRAIHAAGDAAGGQLAEAQALDRALETVEQEALTVITRLRHKLAREEGDA